MVIIMEHTIMTDTSANLLPETIEKNGIKLVRLSYSVGNEFVRYSGEKNFDGDAFYEMLKSGTKVSTSMVNSETFRSCFEAELSCGRDVVYIGMSSGISGTYDAALFAANELIEKYPHNKVYAVDSLGASLGEGLLVLKAISLQKAGKTAEETANYLNIYKYKIVQVFTVDDLMFLRRGGRVSGTTAIIGTILNIKPLLKADNMGKIVVFGKVRGKKRALNELFEIYKEKAVKGNKTAAIAYAGCRDDAEYLAGLIRSASSVEQVLIECYEPVTGSHVGPGTIALFFEGSGR